MKEAYVSFEVVKLLKKKGFNIPSDTSYEDYLWQMYDENGKVHWGIYNNDWYFRITQQIAMRWLREEKGIHIYPIPVTGFSYVASIYTEQGNKRYDKILLRTGRHAYEDAVEAALEYVLKNLI